MPVYGGRETTAVVDDGKSRLAGPTIAMVPLLELIAEVSMTFTPLVPVIVVVPPIDDIV